MAWKIRNAQVYDEQGDVVAYLPEYVEDYVHRTIEIAPEAIEAIQNFVNEVNSGSLKPRSAVKEFEKILIKYNS